jgi:hypothetical protein
MPCVPLGAWPRPFFALLLSLLLGLPPLGISAAEQPAPAKLNIVIVEGEGAINNVRQRTARETIVQVEDENHRPIAGAAVLFMLPDSGPSGTWANGTRTLQVMTDSQGRAVAKGLRVNSLVGKYQIQVQASYEGTTATTTVTQVNSVITAAAAGGVSGKVLAILVIAGGAAAGGVIAATHKGGGTSSTSPPPAPTSTTISAGAPSVGGPPQ